MKGGSGIPKGGAFRLSSVREAWLFRRANASGRRCRVRAYAPCHICCTVRRWASGAVKDGTHAPRPRPSVSFARVLSSWRDDVVTVRSGGSGKTDGGEAS